MRIALASIHPRPLSGQIEGLVGLAEALQERGHAVTLVSAFPPEQLLGAHRLNLTSKHKYSFVDHPARVMRIFKELIRLSSHVDLIQINLPTPAFGMFGDLLQSLVRVPVLVYYEAHLVRTRDLMRADRLYRAPAFYVPRLLINNQLVARLGLFRAALYLVSSRLQIAQLRAVGIPAARIQLAPNLIPEDKRVRVPRATARAGLHLPAGRIITYFGHYNHVKGADVLVHAFRQLAERMGDLRLVLAWSGQGHSPDVTALLNDPVLGERVTQLGRVNLPELLAASDVTVLPYRLTIGQAVFPSAVLETLAANVPLVTTNLPLLDELTNHGKTAHLVEPDNPTALAEGLERVLSESALVQTMLAAQDEWLQRNQTQCLVHEYERIYQQVTLPQTQLLQPVRNRADVQ